MKQKSDPYKLRKMTDEELCKWISEWNDHTGRGHRLLGEHELNRRLRQPDAVRSWIAIFISLAALVLTVVFRLFK